MVTISVDDGHPSDRRAADLLDDLGYAATFYVPARNSERPVMVARDIRCLLYTSYLNSSLKKRD